MVRDPCSFQKSQQPILIASCRYNEGESGSTFSWREQDDIAYAGQVAGTCEFFADLNGDGYADEHFVLGTFNNLAKTSFSSGCTMTDKTGDDASMDGDLPTIPS